jgi:hypothetical protein
MSMERMKENNINHVIHVIKKDVKVEFLLEV